MNSTTISNRKDINTYGAGVEVVAHVVEEEVAEVGEEVVIGEVVATSSRESALPICQQRPEWSAGGSGRRGGCGG